VKFRIQNLHVAVRPNVSGRHDAFAFRVDLQHFFLVRVDLEREAFQIEDDLRHILEDARNRGKFMKDAVDLHRDDGRARQGRKQDAAEGVAQRHAVAAFERFHDEPPVFVVLIHFHDFDFRLFDHNHALTLPTCTAPRHKKALSGGSPPTGGFRCASCRWSSLAPACVSGVADPAVRLTTKWGKPCSMPYRHNHYSPVVSV